LKKKIGKFSPKIFEFATRKILIQEKKGCWGWEPSHSIGINVPNVEFLMV
jgi:hypothetical protein